ncbi:MAG: redox-sensing transcriptional repressor Rex [Candidatus Caldatribacteriota bacterium]|nr:redox-sensing transcriptional repressor Rex [Candidatus Caldatribacteriota bacterium]
MKQNKKNVPSITINRLSIYHRCLAKLIEVEGEKGPKTLSSFRIAEITGINPAQVRKDLAYFGEFGKRGIGYPLIDLVRELKKILGLDKKWSVIVAGAGNLGKALVKYKGFRKRGFVIKGIFDNNLSKIGKKFGYIFIYDIKEIEKFIQAENINIGILVVPADSAQEVADKMVAGGIKAILNFSPIHIVLPPEIKIHNVDLSIEFEGLTYYLNL